MPDWEPGEVPGAPACAADEVPGAPACAADEVPGAPACAADEVPGAPACAADEVPGAPACAADEVTSVYGNTFILMTKYQYCKLPLNNYNTRGKFDRCDRRRIRLARGPRNAWHACGGSGRARLEKPAARIGMTMPAIAQRRGRGGLA